MIRKRMINFFLKKAFILISTIVLINKRARQESLWFGFSSRVAACIQMVGILKLAILIIFDMGVPSKDATQKQK